MSVKVSSTYMAADSASAAADNAAGYECSECGKVFRRDAALRRHREVSHAASSDEDAASRRYRCQSCRRPFTNRAALSAHLSVAHGGDRFSTTEPSSTTKLHESRVGKQPDACDGEILLVEDCCVDDEICIAADGGSAEFQTAEESDGHVAEKNCGQLPRQSSSDVITCLSQAHTNSSGVDVSVAGHGLVSVPHCNNNNSQTKNKNVLVQPTVAVTTASFVHSRVATRSALGSSSIVRPSGVKFPTVTSSTSTFQCVNGLPAFRKPQPGTTAGVPVVGSSSAGASVPTTRLVSVCRAGVETSKSAVGTRGTAAAASQRAVTHTALQQKTPKSPLEAETFHGDAHKPGDGPLLSGFAPTSTTQKIIVYVKTEANHQQQIAYCAAESTTSGAGKGGSGGPCQFVCPVCGRDFASEKYLSMHVSSIHRAANDVASVFALETAAAAPTSVSEAGSPINAAEVTVALTAAAPATMAAQPSSSTSVGGSKSYWTCNICRKAFAQNSSYKNHIRTHSDDRPYVCGICSIGFKERYHLKKHELFKHTTTLNETCRICGKRFKDSTAVRAHERIHSDVRPYGCTLCGKTFKTSECLWHHENRSKTCGKMASRNKHLTVAGVVAVPHQRQRRAPVNHAVSALPTTTRPRQASTVTPTQFEPIDEDEVKPELTDLKPADAECNKVACRNFHG